MISFNVLSLFIIISEVILSIFLSNVIMVYNDNINYPLLIISISLSSLLSVAGAIGLIVMVFYIYEDCKKQLEEEVMGGKKHNFFFTYFLFSIAVLGEVGIILHTVALGSMRYGISRDLKIAMLVIDGTPFFMTSSFTVVVLIRFIFVGYNMLIEKIMDDMRKKHVALENDTESN